MYKLLLFLLSFVVSAPVFGYQNLNPLNAAFHGASSALRPVFKPKTVNALFIPAARTRAQAAPSKDSGKTVVYLAGAWGFFDFDASKDTYKPYLAKVKVQKFRTGFHMLAAFEKDVEKMGFKALNPWTETIHDAYIGGVMFGAGVDLEGKKWSEGNLKAKTMNRNRLLHWIHMIEKNPLVKKSEYSFSKDTSFETLEEIYRNMVGDVIFRGNKKHVENADIVFANLNLYRKGGDADDGTLWELDYAMNLGKRIVVLVDKNPESTLGEGIFGKNNRWNMMVSGAIKDYPENKKRIFHDLGKVKTYLEGLESKKESKK